MPGVGVLTLPVNVVTYNIDALVGAVDALLDVTTQYQAFASSVMVWEQCATQASRAIYAVLWRQAKMVIYVYICPRKDQNLATLRATIILYLALTSSTTPSTRNSILNDNVWDASTQLRQSVINGAKEIYDPRNRIGYYKGLARMPYARH